MLKRIAVSAAALALFSSVAFAEETTIDTRIGPLTFTHDFENGYPTTETQEKLFDEIDFQRACQAYLWALPIVSMAQAVYALSYEDKLGGLTYNTTTPYVLQHYRPSS